MDINFLLEGISRSMNLFPEKRESIYSPPYSDEEAFRQDLEQVGSDMRIAINTIEQSKSFPDK